ncbi:hypothetical protein [Amycolatopsis sp.]|uniref:hypothetical protein n=1 Tax=Amycolatopsis sp. TaxID=37632 RepID=UPI002E03020F|nr:hypothetical protein [Amycolatopsis sp.]
MAQFLAGLISAVDIVSGEVETVVPMDGPVQSPDDLAFGPDGEYTLVSEEVLVPNGIACVGDRLFVNEMRPGGRLLKLFQDGREPVVLTGGPRPFAGLAVGPDGSLHLSADGEGSVLHLSRPGPMGRTLCDRS